MIKLCRLVVVPRVGYRCPDLKKLEQDVPGLCRNLIMLSKPWIDISATMIREQVIQGEPVDQLVPQKVACYIKQHHIYRNSA
jgi:nicotinate-nucleotide adenylyltransferase